MENVGYALYFNFWTVMGWLAYLKTGDLLVSWGMQAVGVLGAVVMVVYFESLMVGVSSIVCFVSHLVLDEYKIRLW